MPPPAAARFPRTRGDRPPDGGKEMKLYSYIVVSDNGYAPNPTGGVCTLAYCKPTLRRVAQPGDYIVGLAGSEYRKRVGSAGQDYPIIYAMRVTDVIDSKELYFNERYRRHRSSDPNARAQVAKTNRALVSSDFIYWGGDGPPLPGDFSGLIKKGPGHKCNFSLEVVQAFIKWFEMQSGRGCLGTPYDGWFSAHSELH